MERLMVISFVLLCGLAIGTHSAVYLERQPFILGHKGECYDEQSNTFYKAGEEMKWRAKECGRKYCAGTHGVEIQTCGKIGAPPECHVESNPDLPYPKCCGWIICPTPSEFAFYSENELE